MAYATVQAGIYFGFTLAEMQTEQARYKAEVQKVVGGPRNVVGASVNGKSFSYGPGGGGLTLAQWQAEIQDALSQVDDDVIALPNATLARFQ